MKENCAKSKIVNFHLTGFGKFSDIKDNPSSKVVDDLPFILAENLIIANKNTQLKVSTSACQKYNKYIEDNINKDTNNDNLHVIVHFGVSGDSLQIRIENIGYNMADFGIPDEDNNQPKKQKINHKMELDAPISTRISVDKIVKNLKSKKVIMSQNPGRFICNYMYFINLSTFKNTNVESLFIHVPFFQEISNKEQVFLIRRILIEIGVRFLQADSSQII